MIRVVLDSNVLASGIVRSNSGAAPVQVIDAWRAGRFELAISQDILDEVSRTLNKRYFRARLSEDQIERALLLLTRRARLVELAVEVQGVATHPEDDRILAAALSAQVGYIVTGGAGLLAIIEASKSGRLVISSHHLISSKEQQTPLEPHPVQHQAGAARLETDVTRIRRR